MLMILNNEWRPPADLRPHIDQQLGDTGFKHAVSNRSTEAVVTALWTKAYLTFPNLDATQEGYEIYVPLDAVRGTLFAAHETAHHRIEQAGVQLNSQVQIYYELQLDRLRGAMVPGLMNVFGRLTGSIQRRPDEVARNH
ncbi:hypothetical protein [Bradyrhizobium tunisiense]|uniref:hypothetical protein n=1 Tax=Bradyrhizobium tunisiense TaxID=3278709 RepID=UPI0035DC570B